MLPDDRPQLILLGASNLTRAISTVVGTATQWLGAPLDVLAALGHGRSYGMRSSIFFGVRALPSILNCGLWDALARSERKTNTLALITDIGNDIIYGAPAETIADWVEQCVDRLQQRGTSVAMTMLPIETLRAVKPWQYHIVKTVMFPTRQMRFDEAIARADRLHELITEMAARRAVRIIQPQPKWYGFDPIHVRRRFWSSAWADILSACLVDDADDTRTCARPSPLRWARLRTMRPQQWWLAGMELQTKQAAGTLRDGTRISLF